VNERKMEEEINQREWEDPDNWTTIYFSKKDKRSWVPKKNPKHGVTINFGSPAGSRWIYYLFLLFFIIGVIIGSSITLVMLQVA